MKIGNRKSEIGNRTALTGAILLLLCATVFAASGPDSDHRMEFFGMGPELFADRGIQWVKALSGIIKEAIGELGIIALAFYALQKNLKGQQQIQTVKDDITARLDSQAKRITDVAIASGTPAGMPAATITEPTVISPSPQQQTPAGF